jgi:hypothetical protein
MTERAGAPRSVIVAFSLLALITAGWCIYWFSLRAKLQGDVAELRASLAGLGIQLNCSEETWSGFPFRYALSCRKPRLQGEYESRPTEVKAEQLRFYMQAYNPFHIMALADGPTMLNGTVISHKPARASLHYDTNGNWDLGVEMPAADLAGAASADMVKLFARVKDGKLQLAADTQNLRPGNSEIPALSAAATAETDAALLVASDFIHFAKTAGTSVSITSMKLLSGSVAVEGSGQLNLDGNGRLNGTLNISVNDMDALLALLAPPLKLTPEQVTGAKAVIGLIGGNQQGKPTRIDIIAKSGELYFGPFKIADVPPFE